MEKLVIDCDNTFGAENCDIDDGLAILFALGSPDVEVMGVTSTYGNHTIEVTWQQLNRFKQGLNLTVPIYKGREGIRNSFSDGAVYLAKIVGEYPYEITIVALGALTNLYDAAQIDPLFFEKVKRVIVMGGTTKPLIFHGKEVKELNFSVAPVATRALFESSVDLTVMNGHVTKTAFFGVEESQNLENQLKEANISKRKTDYLMKGIHHWLTYNEAHYQVKGFCNWDVAAIAFVLAPTLFSHDWVEIDLAASAFQRGRMVCCNDVSKGRGICMPTQITDVAELNRLFCEYVVNALK